MKQPDNSKKKKAQEPEELTYAEHQAAVKARAPKKPKEIHE